MTTLDPRIGTTNNGKFYAFVDGFDAPEFVGTREEVETALGLRAPTRNETRFTVTMRFQHPAWDEVNGIAYPEIRADTKAEAIAVVRLAARADGHAMGGKGRYWFTAEIEE